jgi:hypothetical protein
MTGSPVSDLLPFGWEQVNLTGDYVLDTQPNLSENAERLSVTVPD